MVAETRRQKLLDLVGTIEAARILKVDITTIHRWFDRGMIPGVLVEGTRGGPRRLMRRADVEKFAAERARR